MAKSMDHNSHLRNFSVAIQISCITGLLICPSHTISELTNYKT